MPTESSSQVCFDGNKLVKMCCLNLKVVIFRSRPPPFVDNPALPCSFYMFSYLTVKLTVLTCISGGSAESAGIVGTNVQQNWERGRIGRTECARRASYHSRTGWGKRGTGMGSDSCRGSYRPN